MDEPRVELMPLIDVIFLLLTFFVFALALMVRADVLDVRLPEVASGTPASPGAIVTVAINADGVVFVDGEEIAIEEIVGRVRDRRDALTAEGGEARILVAPDENSRSGVVIRVIDALRYAGVGDISVMGRPGAAPTDSGG
jgi:biopolymer transport protein ExbD